MPHGERAHSAKHPAREPAITARFTVWNIIDARAATTPPSTSWTQHLLDLRRVSVAVS
jgi:hypothetical protein